MQKKELNERTSGSCFHFRILAEIVIPLTYYIYLKILIFIKCSRFREFKHLYIIPNVHTYTIARYTRAFGEYTHSCTQFDVHSKLNWYLLNFEIPDQSNPQRSVEVWRKSFIFLFHNNLSFDTEICVALNFLYNWLIQKFFFCDYAIMNPLEYIHDKFIWHSYRTHSSKTTPYIFFIFQP